MPEFTNGVSSLFRTVLGIRGAQQQVGLAWRHFYFIALALRLIRGVCWKGGLLSGNDPTQFSEQDPLRLWIIQVGERYFIYLHLLEEPQPFCPSKVPITI